MLGDVSAKFSKKGAECVADIKADITKYFSAHYKNILMKRRRTDFPAEESYIII